MPVSSARRCPSVALLLRAGPTAPSCEALQRSPELRRAAGSSRLAAAHRRATLLVYGEPPLPLLCPESTASDCLLLSPGNRPERRLPLSKRRHAAVAAQAMLRHCAACVRHATSACSTRAPDRAHVHGLHGLPHSAGRGYLEKKGLSIKLQHPRNFYEL
jgi:hypothetical protein